MREEQAMANSDVKSGQSATEKTTGKAKTDALQAELAELRAQLDALRARSAAEAGKGAPESAPSPGAGGQASEAETEEEVDPDLSTQLQTLLQGLDKEFKESNPMTLLAVFGLGILVGRLLSR
jgi:hypothetical protein